MKNTRNTKIKSYEFGVNQTNNYNQIGNLAGVAGGTIQAASGNSGAGNIIGGVGKGVMAGAAFGPVGMIAGGALGAVTSVIANGKAKKQQTLQDEAMQRQEDIARANNLQGFSSQMQSDYYDRAGQNIPTFNNGGITGSELAYLDHNESVRTPDGNMFQVKGFNPRATDDVLTNLPNGTGVLSDNLKIPGTNSTFAEAGHNLVKGMNKTNKNMGPISETTSKLNKWSANQKYNGFLALQDEGRDNKGVKNKVKKFALGTPVQQTIDPLSTYATSQFSANTTIPQTRDLRYTNNIQPSAQYLNAPSTVNYTNTIPNYNAYTTNNTLQNNTPASSGNGVNNVLGGLENAAYTMGSLAPMIYNLKRGNERPDFVAPNMNPYASNITSSMAKRRVDLDPLYAANRRATRIANYNANNMTGTGQNMAFRLANAAAERTANTETNLRAQQINNDYMSQEADVLNNLGQQMVRERNYSDDLNRKNIERTRDFTATGLSQLNEWSQMQQLSKNRKESDSKKYDIWKQLAKYGLSQADLKNIDKIIN